MTSKENREKMKDNRPLKAFVLLLINFFFFSCSSIKIDETQKRFLLDEKGKDKFYLIDFINKNSLQLGKTPSLIIHKIDGQQFVRSDREFKEKLNLKKKDFIRTEIVSIEKSINLYGSAGKDGVLIIYNYKKSN